MATTRLSPDQLRDAAARRDYQRRSAAYWVERGLPQEESGVALQIRELGASPPLIVLLRKSVGVEVGAEWGNELRGETRTPYGSSEGYSTVTGIAYGQTEMKIPIEPAFIRNGDFKVINSSVNPTSANEILEFFQRLQARGREFLVTLGPLARRGVLRRVQIVPGRGTSIDLDGSRTAPSFNASLTLTWEWSGKGEPGPAPEPPATGADIAGQLGAADSGFGLALADMDGAFDPDAITAISGAIGRVRGQISKLRQTVRQLGSLATAPARLANEAMAAARGLGNALNDLEEQIGDTRDAYLALGKAADDTRRALGPRPSGLAKATTAKGSIRGANQQAMDACIAVFDAIAKRKRRRVTVRPGQSLADVARAELGAADRWREIADLNDLAGQVVPPGRTAVDLPEGA